MCDRDHPEKYFSPGVRDYGNIIFTDAEAPAYTNVALVRVAHMTDRESVYSGFKGLSIEVEVLLLRKKKLTLAEVEVEVDRIVRNGQGSCLLETIVSHMWLHSPPNQK